MTTSERAQLMERGLSEIFNPVLRSSIVELLEQVRSEGDEAVCRALAHFDGVQTTPERLRVSEAEFAAARSLIGSDVVAAIRDLIAHLRSFNRQLLERHGDWSFESEPGLMVGEKVSPISSAGLFCPSGKASYPSVLCQLGTPAVEAGVPTIAVIVPPVPGGSGEVDPAVLVVAAELGLTNVFRANGPAGVAAMAFGTESIPKVVKVVGPGSPAVTCAQVEIQRYGVATMMLLGPSESMILADSSADPMRLAADLLNEAEHGTDSASVLITDCEALIAPVQLELTRQLALLPTARRQAAEAAIGVNGGCVLVASISEGAEIANQYGPEHLQIATADPEATLELIHTAGEILLGQHTLFSAGNFVIGCPASLPTSGFAHVSSGITVDAFLKRSAVARADERAMRRMGPTIEAFADHEGFPAHANALRHRLAAGG